MIYHELELHMKGPGRPSENRLVVRGPLETLRLLAKAVISKEVENGGESPAYKVQITTTEFIFAEE